MLSRRLIQNEYFCFFFFQRETIAKEASAVVAADVEP